MGVVRAVLVAALGLALLAASVADWRTLRLPDVLTAIAAGLSVALAATRSPSAAWLGLVAAAATVMVLEIARRAFRRLRGREGLGAGDVKLAGALALWLGFATPWGLLAGSLIGLLVSRRKAADERFAFGPALAAGAFAVGLFEEAFGWPL
jgi:leader peptidase (prepilin peptidase)/N-methyltransferase